VISGPYGGVIVSIMNKLIVNTCLSFWIVFLPSSENAKAAKNPV